MPTQPLPLNPPTETEKPNRWRRISEILNQLIREPMPVNGFVSRSGATASTASGTAVDLSVMPTLPGQSVYLVSASIAASNDAPNYNATALVSTNGTTIKLTNLQTAALMTFALSGMTVRGTQSSGISAPITWTVVRLQ